MVFYSGTAVEWLRKSKREKKRLIGSVLAIQKQKTVSQKEKTA